MVDQPRPARGGSHATTVKSLPHVLEAVVPAAFAVGRGEPTRRRRKQPALRLGLRRDDVASSRRRRADVRRSSPTEPTWPTRYRRRSRAAVRVRDRERSPTSSPTTLDAIVVALAGDATPRTPRPAGKRVLAEHDGIVDQLHADARWARAVADYAAWNARPGPLGDADRRVDRRRSQPGPGGRAARAQRPQGHARTRVAAFAVSVESSDAADRRRNWPRTCLCSPDRRALSGAELVAGPGWFGAAQPPASERQRRASAARPFPAGSTTCCGASCDDRRSRRASSTPTSTCGTRRAPTGTRTCPAASS